MLVATLIGCLTFGRPSKVYAIGPELLAAVPVSWPVVVAVLVAAGVGTAIYYNSLDEESRASLLEDVVDALVVKKLTLAQKAAAEGAIAINTIGSYVRAAIVNGRSYLSTDVTNTILDTAKARGLTGGVVDRVTGVQTMTLNSVMYIGQDFYKLDRLMTPTSYGSSVTINWGSIQQHAKAMEIIRVLPYGAYWVCASVTNDVVVYTSVLDGLSGEYKAKGYQQYGRMDVWGATVDGSVTSHYWRIDRGGNIINDFDLDRHIIWFNVAPSFGGGYVNTGNVGKYTVASSGAPIGELGQAVEQDGAWDYPTQLTEIDNYGAAIGVSTSEAAIGIDGIARAWEPSVAYPDIALPDVVPDIAIDVPSSLTQAKAIEGEMDEPKPIADEPPIVPEVGSFLVPSWVKERFPFCIPFDLLAILEKFRGSGTAAPVIDMHVPISGEDMHIYFDLAYFDPVCQVVRYGIYLFFLVDLIRGTRELIGW